MKKYDLTEGSILSHVQAIAIPASVGFFFNTMFNVVDSIYAGQLSTDALAGLSLSFPIFFLIIAIGSGIGNGTSTLSAIAIGKKDIQEYHQLARNSLIMALIVGVALIFLAPFIIEPLFRLTGAEGASLALGVAYTQTIFYGSLFFLLNFALNGLLASQGNTKPYRNYLIIGFFMNLILDPLLIFGWFGLPALGTVGVALATVIVQFFGTIYLAYRWTKSELFDLNMLKTAFASLSTIKELMKQVIPSSLNSATIALGIFIINYYVLFYGGSQTIAAYGAAVRIEQLVLLPTLGLNVAVLSIVGQNFGAGNFERIMQARALVTKVGVMIMLFGVVVIYPASPYLIQIFNGDSVVISAGTTYLRIEVFAFLTYVFLNMNISVLQGIKKPNFALWIGMFRQFLPFVLFYFLGTTLNMGILGVWWGIVIINWTAVGITMLYTKSQLKKLELRMSTTP
ncbi:MAG: MATE family efflux transporter [Erysipelotrichaceae bacterium]|nr:MATE family efflux transporter [Erysipelotrichaceae bacterium]